VFSESVFRDVLGSFANLDRRAGEVADEYFHRVGTQPVGEYDDVDMADVADDAQEYSISWYRTMTALRQTMLNLMVSGLFHLVGSVPVSRLLSGREADRKHLTPNDKRFCYPPVLQASSARLARDLAVT
jgi:hypothetical protein